MEASLYFGKETYPVYCCCFGKAVVHVPIGGILKCIVMFPSTGEGIVFTPEFAVIGGGYCAIVNSGQRRDRPMIGRRAAGSRFSSHCEGQHRVP